MLKKIKKTISVLKKINSIEKKVNLLNADMQLLMPDILPLNEGFKHIIADFNKEHNPPENVNYAISKNDLMFRYSCYHLPNLNEAFKGYLHTGLNPLNLIRKITQALNVKNDDIENMLDFASGYGRVTRFLVAAYGNDKVWASEIKEGALRFINQQFGCKTIPSSFTPEHFQPNCKFDLIYVGSLFSHLPENTFLRWLKVLYNCLSENGTLIISTHDISLINKSNPNAYVFIPESEDKMFDEIKDSIKEINKYGAAFIGSKKIEEIFNEAAIQKNNYYRFNKVLSNVQDIYVIRKKEISFTEVPELTQFP